MFFYIMWCFTISTTTFDKKNGLKINYYKSKLMQLLIYKLQKYLMKIYLSNLRKILLLYMKI